MNVEDVVGEVMKTVAKAEETRAERRTALANILSGKGKGRKKKVGLGEEKFGELLLNEWECLRECEILLCRQN